MTKHIKFRQQHCKVKPYTLAGFEPGIFCSGGGRDDDYARAGLEVIEYDTEIFFFKKHVFATCRFFLNGKLMSEQKFFRSFLTDRVSDQGSRTTLFSL
jgi:hypothetical protein